MVTPRNTLLFHLESDEEADWAIQVAVDVKAQLDQLNKELGEMNCQATMVKAAKVECQWEWQ